MKQFNKFLLLGLYAYLRQIELSLDRASPESWDKMLSFFHDKTPPEKVVYCLMADNTQSSDSFNKTKHSAKQMLLDRILLRDLDEKRHPLTLSQIRDICICLNEFGAMLKSKILPETEVIVGLRLKLRYISNGLETIFSKIEIKKAKNIEHFNQNPILELNTLEEILGGTWLK